MNIAALVGFLLGLLLIGVCTVSVNLFFIFRYLWKKRTRYRSLTMGVTSALMAVVFIVIIHDGINFYFITQANENLGELQFKGWILRSWSLSQTYTYESLQNYFIPTLLLIIFIASSLVINIILTLRYLWRKKSQFRNGIINASLFCFTLFYMWSVLEFVAYLFIVQSDGFGFTLASKRWFSEYWKPINSYGYRDSEHNLNDGKRLLFVVGDSFVTGHGIKDHKDRFSDLLGEKLPAHWSVVNIAKNGWSTNSEYKAITSYPQKPEVIVLSYYINDIQNAAARSGLDFSNLIEPPPRPIRPFVEYSHLINFIYWRIYRYAPSGTRAARYLDLLEKAYLDEDIWSEHIKELIQVIDFSRNNNVRLLVVVFPNLNNMDDSHVYTSKVVRLMREHNIPVVDMAENLAGRNPRDLVINSVDSHPNTSLHREVANLIDNHLKRNNIISSQKR